MFFVLLVGFGLSGEELNTKHIVGSLAGALFVYGFVILGGLIERWLIIKKHNKSDRINMEVK